MGKTLILDTNSLQACFDRQAYPERHKRFEKLITTKEIDGIIFPCITIYEIFIILKQLYKEDALKVLDDILSFFSKIAPTNIFELRVTADLLNSFHGFRNLRLNFPDAIIASIAHVTKGILVTADRNFEKASKELEIYFLG